MSATTVRPTRELRAALASLLADPHPAARAIGRAVEVAAADPPVDGGRWVERIERLRIELEAREEPISIGYPGARPRQDTIAQVTRRCSKREPWGRFLYHLLRELRPERCLELGTCVGVSTAYQAAALADNDAGTIVTIEGAAALSQVADQNLSRLGLGDRARLVVGRFRETLDGVLEDLNAVDYAFVDGHHDETATLAYFDQVAHRLAEDAVVVFDDIAWSEGMARAWQAIIADPRVAVAVDLKAVGAVVTRSRPAGSEAERALVHQLDAVTRLGGEGRTIAARRAIEAIVPEGATVLVVSKGDDELLAIEGRAARHFPRGLDGGWTGYHPADDAEAIEGIERARTEGAEFLAFPSTSAWWLDHYRDFRRHLETRYRLLRADGPVIVYDLRDRPCDEEV